MRREPRTVGAPPIDREALLVALVLVPSTYSRNRFFHLYADPEVRRVRHRASQIRSIVRHLTRDRDDERAREVVLDERVDGGELTYVVPKLGLKRTSYLDASEIALVRYATTRALADRSPLVLQAEDRARIEAALARNAPVTRVPATDSPAPPESL